MLVSRSLRSEYIPNNTILIRKDSQKPTGWADDCTLYGKFLIGTATACTCPGSTVGSTNHTHNSVGNHTHTAGGSTAHTHVISTGIPSARGGTDIGSCSFPSGSHGHSITSNSTSPAATPVSNGAHTHDTLTLEPAHKTLFFIKKSESSIAMRRKTLPPGNIFMWGQTSASLPTEYAHDTGFNCKHIKGVAGACSSPFQCVGSNTHQHNAESSHNHTVNLAAHSHSTTGNVSGYTGLDTLTGSGCPLYDNSPSTHIHGSNTLAGATNCITGMTSGGTLPGSTQHASSNHEPAYKSSIFASSSVTNMRIQGFVSGAISIWNNTVASIPPNNQVADGTNGTANYLGQYLRGSGTPGTTGGNATHCHGAAGSAHTHGAASGSHNHPASGSTGNSDLTAFFTRPPSGTGISYASHTHAASSVSSTTPSFTLNSASNSHTHNSINNSPPSVVVSFIEKL